MGVESCSEGRQVSSGMEGCVLPAEVAHHDDLHT